MRATAWAAVLLAAALGAAAWWLGPGWNLGQAMDRAATPLAAVPAAATVAALVPAPAATAVPRPAPTASVGPAPAPASARTADGPAPTPATARTAPATPDPGTQVIAIAEDDVNDYLGTAAYGQELANTPFGAVTVEDMRVQFRPGEVIVSGAARSGPGRLAFQITGALVAADGTLRVTVRDATVNDLPLPAAMRASVEMALAAQLSAALKAEGLRVTGVELGNRSVAVRVTRQAR